MSPEELKVMARRFYEEVWNNRNLSSLEELIAPEYTILDTQIHGPDGYRRFVENMLQTFPDIHFTLDEFIAAADRTIVRWTWQGTHRGTWFGVPATGKVVTSSGVSITRVNPAGKAVEERLIGDHLIVLQQMGATISLPTPAPAQPPDTIKPGH
jgi:steroid delta-isomerase-like uncharacterized protein